MWQRYYTRWHTATRACIDPELLGLMPELRRYSPPATVIDKTRYSAFFQSSLLQHLLDREADGLIVTGAETDVCVLATVLSAVDLGYRVILVRDALCSSSGAGHDALMKMYHARFSEQIETSDRNGAEQLGLTTHRNLKPCLAFRAWSIATNDHHPRRLRKPAGFAVCGWTSPPMSGACYG